MHYTEKLATNNNNIIIDNIANIDSVLSFQQWSVFKLQGCWLCLVVNGKADCNIL